MLASVMFSTRRVLELKSWVCKGKQCYLSLTTLRNACKWWCPPDLHLCLGAKMSTIKGICVVYMTLSAESLSIKSQPHSRVLATCTCPSLTTKHLTRSIFTTPPGQLTKTSCKLHHTLLPIQAIFWWQKRDMDGRSREFIVGWGVERQKTKKQKLSRSLLSWQRLKDWI